MSDSIRTYGETLWKDTRFGVRMLRKSPGFTAIAALSLAIGIGANTTVFCWIQNILIRPFAGVAKQEELVVLTTQHGTAMWDSLSLPDLKDLAKLKEVFAGVIGSAPLRAELAVDGHSEWNYGQIATANFFSVLGVKPLLGRAFVAEEDEQPGGHPVLVLSEGFWRRRFAGDPSIVGRNVDINRHSFTIVGVVPGKFRGTMTGLNCDFWAPLSMCEEVMYHPRTSLDNRSDRWVNTQARLRPGVSHAQAQAALDTLAAQLEQEYPNSNKEVRPRVLPLWKTPYGGQPLMLPVLSLLQAVSLGVLLIVAVNVANLLLARASRREKEVAIRLALGADRGRLIRQLLTESLLLSLLGGAGGVLLAHWMVGLLELFLPNNQMPLGFAVSMNSQTLGCALLLTLATGLIFGLAPALQSSRPHLNETLKEGGRAATSGTPHHRVLNVFVVSQIALAVVLLICAGLCLKGLRKARQIDLGFEPDHLLYVGFNVDMNWDIGARLVFAHSLQQRLAALPGVQGVALASWYPLGFDPNVGNWAVEVAGYPRRPNEDLDVYNINVATGYFAAMRIPLLEGREFTDGDDDKARRVVIVNEAMAKRFWPGQSPIGRTVTSAGTTWTVVGIAKTGKYRTLTEPTRCFFYTPYRQWPYSILLGVGVRTAGSPASMANVVREEVHRLAPGVSIWANLPMTDYIQPAFMTQQAASSLLTLLGVVALALAAMGVYGVMAYVVSQRTHEFGIRMALGASGQDVQRLVLRRGMRLAVLGAAIGVGLALGVTRLLASFLYGVSSFDAETFAGTTLLLGLISLAACWLPAHRATKVNPVEALRHE
jgi:predicted permease